MKSLSRENQAGIIEAFHFQILLRLSTSRYLDDLLNTDTEYFEQMIDQIIRY